MKTLKEICENIIYKKCNFIVNPKLNWLNYGYRCIRFRFYQELIANEFWFCTCKTRVFYITRENGKSYTITSRQQNCFHCWFSFLIEIKVKNIYKKKDSLVHLVSLLTEFFSLINKFKYIYVRPNYQKMELEYYETFNYYLNPNLGCLCYENYSCINFL